jgi:hypothetical protein
MRGTSPVAELQPMPTRTSSPSRASLVLHNMQVRVSPGYDIAVGFLHELKIALAPEERLGDGLFRQDLQALSIPLRPTCVKPKRLFESNHEDGWLGIPENL